VVVLLLGIVEIMGSFTESDKGVSRAVSFLREVFLNKRMGGLTGMSIYREIKPIRR
jgi:hypothetical protein